MNNKKIKSLGLALICQFILHKVCNDLKLETSLYQQKTKKMLNQLLDTITPVLKSSISLKIIEEATQSLKREIDVDGVSEDVSIQGQCIEILVDTLLEQDVARIHELHLLLSNFQDGKRLYTEEELAIERSLEHNYPAYL